MNNILLKLHKKAKEIAVYNAAANYHPLSLDEYATKWNYTYQGTPVDDLTVNQQIEIVLAELENQEKLAGLFKKTSEFMYE